VAVSETGREQLFQRKPETQMAKTTAKKAQASKSNSVTAAVEAAVAASLPSIEPPSYVSVPEAARPFWDALIESRARSEWSKSDLIVAGQLARCQSEIEAQEEMLQAEGHVISNGRGTPVANPRQNILEQLARRQLACMRALQMGGTARGTRKEDLVNKRKLEREARGMKEDLTNEQNATRGLLA
jgi:hypothetical protein